MCQIAFFPCLQGINMLRSKREEQKTDVYIQSRVQKKIRCKSIQSSEKKEINGSEKN